MRRLLLWSALVIVLVLLVGAALARASYQSTYRRSYGAIPPFEVEITVVDARGVSIPQPILTLLDTETLEAADTSLFVALDQGTGITGDANGHVALRFGGQGIETEDWQLFWLFPQVISGPRGLDNYLVAIAAPGHPQTKVVLICLLGEHVGMVPLPDDPTRQMFRYIARVTMQ